MIKVSHLITGLGSGGAERMLSLLVTHGGQADVSHAVISMLDAGFFGTEIERAGVPLNTLRMARGKPSLGAFLRLCRLLKRERPDVLQTWLYHADLMGFLAGRVAGVPRIVWNVRCSDMDMSRYSWLGRIALAWLSRLSPLVDAIVVNSTTGRHVHERLGYRPNHWTMIPNGFDLDRFRPSEHFNRRFRQEIGAAAHQVVVGMVARFDPMKNHTAFLDAAVSIAATRSNVIFVFVGSGCESDGALACQVAARGLGGQVRLLGERNDVADILPGFDVFVLSSAYGEGFPNVIGEAMASGVPVIATDVGDSRAIIGDTGAVVPPADVEALGLAIGRMIDIGTGARAELGRAARARVKSAFLLPDVIRQYECLYRDLVAGK